MLIPAERASAPLRTVRAALLGALAIVIPVASSALAQEPEARAPALEWRHVPVPDLERLRSDSLVAFDPWLDAVVPGRPAPLPARERLPVVSGLAVLDYLEKLADIRHHEKTGNGRGIPEPTRITSPRPF